MHDADLSRWTHSHVFDRGNPLGARNTRWVVLITAAMMVVEIAAGWVFGSMALLADGWHMSTHAVALGMTVFAYALSRRRAQDPRYSLGAWKIEVLGGFASAVVLGMVALYMGATSLWRLFQPHTIQYDQALVVAAVGLAVNLGCALLLKDASHSLHEPHRDAGDGHHHDLNLRSAYMHVVADALTSVFAIVALIGGKLFDWDWLDPTMGIVGAVIVSTWAYALLRDTSRVLLDREMDHKIVQEIRSAIEADGETKITDLHLTRVGRQQFACVVSVVTARPKPALEYKERLRQHEELVHVTVEVLRCEA